MKDRTNRAVEYLLDERGVDYIVDTYTTSDFVECVCSIGGDIVTYRIYDKNNGFTVVEK